MKLSKFIKISDLMPQQADPASGAPDKTALDKLVPESALLAPPVVAPAAPSIISAPASTHEEPERPAMRFSRNRMPEPVPADLQESAPAKDDSYEIEPVAKKNQLFEERPTGIYEAAIKLGIQIPESRETILRRASNCLMTVFRKVLMGAPGRNMVWPMVKSIASDIEGIIAEDANIVTLLHRYRVQKEKILWHSLYTAILAMDLSRNVRVIDDCSLQDLGGAALLHDIGLLTEPGALDIVDFEPNAAFHDHVTRGVALAREIEAPDTVINMIAQHHRRLDDPDPQPEPFPIDCQIVAIANLFEHAVIDLSVESQNGSSSHNDMSLVFKQYRKAFDDDLLKEMISLIGFYPVGSMVELNTHAICEVIRQNEDMPLRPVVKVVVDGFGNHPEITRVIDLKQARVLSVTRTLAAAAQEKQ